MLKFVVVLHRKPGTSREQFRRYLEDVHGPMAFADLGRTTWSIVDERVRR
jgi:EthD domain-containing protein